MLEKKVFGENQLAKINFSRFLFNLHDNSIFLKGNSQNFLPLCYFGRLLQANIQENSCSQLK